MAEVVKKMKSSADNILPCLYYINWGKNLKLVEFLKYAIFKKAFIMSKVYIIKLVSKYLVKIREQGANETV